LLRSFGTMSALEMAARVISLLISIPVHESAHAWVSYKLGDPTAKRLGRISLNPMRHFDLMGSLSMLLFGIGWAKPVPVDPRYYHNKRLGMAISSFAGPVSNIILAYISLALFKLLLPLSLKSNLAYFAVYILLYLCRINIVLGVFNMIPIPPFDGSKIVMLLLPEKIYFKVLAYERYIFLGVMLLLFTGVLSRPLSYVTNAVFNLLDISTVFFGRVSFAMIWRS